MKVIYSDETFELPIKNSIFLAGPTPRTGTPVPSWRPEALRALEKAGFDGLVFVPEYKNQFNYLEKSTPVDFMSQVEWEYRALENCDLIAFWVPRSKHLPGFTTNVEFGSYVRSNRIIYGRPDDAEKTDYLDWLYTRIAKRLIYNDLEQLMQQATLRMKHA